jgi:protein required for attachment to host cells
MGKKALFLDLTGTVLHPHLRLRKATRGGENPATHEQGSDRPGRAFQSVGWIRSAMEQADGHELGEMRLISQIISELEAFYHANSSQKLVLIAPPRILSYLRQQLPRSTK